MTETCDIHREIRLGSDPSECPVCLAERWILETAHGEAYFDAIADRWADWLRDEQANGDQRTSDLLVDVLKRQPSFNFLIFIYREFFGKKPEPLTIAVIVCDLCQNLVRVDEWRGKDAHPGESHCISHGRCDRCGIIGYQAIEATQKRGAA